MKFAKPFLIFLLVFFILFLIAIIIISGIPPGQSENAIGETHTLKEFKKDEEDEMDAVLPVEEIVNAFIAVIYDYDTSERAFYEGADKYMTESAYLKLVPLQNEDEPTDIPHMISVLDEVKHYYRHINDEQVEVLSEVWYRVTGTGEYRIRAILKLKLILEDQWLIQECSVLDTLEE